MRYLSCETNIDSFGNFFFFFFERKISNYFKKLSRRSLLLFLYERRMYGIFTSVRIIELWIFNLDFFLSTVAMLKMHKCFKQNLFNYFNFNYLCNNTYL